MTQTIEWPYIDAATVHGATPSPPQAIEWPFIEAGHLFGATVLNEDVPDIEILVGGVPIAHTFAKRFEEQLADTGSFAFSMRRDDFLATTIAFDDEIVIRLFGVPRFRGVVEDLAYDSLGPGGGQEHTVRVAGRGALALLAKGGVYPSRGPGALPIEDVRSYSWVGADFDPAAAGWKPPKIVNSQQSYADTGAPRPDVWVDITGKWIGPKVPGVTSLDAPEGITLYRHSFTLASTKLTRHFLAADAVLRVWIDGAEQTWFAGADGRYIQIELGPGTHYIAVKVANNVDVPGENNPTGLLAAGFTVGADGLLDEQIYETNTTWYHLPYPVRAPGFTVGKVEELLLDEGGLSDWTMGFTEHLDSAGRPWTYQREITLNVGRNVLDAQRELMDVHADIACVPGEKRLLAWNRGTRGRVTDVELVQTNNPKTSDFVSLRHEGKRARANKVLIRYGGGHTTYEDADSIDEHGELFLYLEVGHITDEQEAQEYAAVIVENRARPSFSTFALLQPRTEDEDGNPFDGSTPYKAFGVGDWITCPNELGVDELMRVASIERREDQNGVVTWWVALRDIRFEEEERTRVWLSRMADGTAVGGARVASRAGTPAATVQQITTLEVAEFSHDNTVLGTGYSPIRPVSKSGNVVQVVVEVTNHDAMTGDAEIEVRYGTAGQITSGILGGTLLASVTIPQGQREKAVPINIVPVHARATKMQSRVVSGGQAEGLSVQIHAI